MISRKNVVYDLIFLDRFAEAKTEHDLLLVALEKARGIDDKVTRAARRDAVRIAMLTNDQLPGAMDIEALSDDADATSKRPACHSAVQRFREEGQCGPALKFATQALALSESSMGLHPTTLQMLRQVAISKRDTNAPTTTDTYAKLERRMRLWSRREYASTTDEATLEQVGKWTRKSVGDILYSFKASRTDPKAQQLFATVLAEWKAVGTSSARCWTTPRPGCPRQTERCLKGYAPCARRRWPSHAALAWMGSSGSWRLPKRRWRTAFPACAIRRRTRDRHDRAAAA